MRTALALLVGRLARHVIRWVRHGGGSALPGRLASLIQPRLLQEALTHFPRGLIVVSGSAGKSSTTHYLVHILKSQGLTVFTNSSTANISRGLDAAVLQAETGIALPSADIAVLEMDEAYAAKMSEFLGPKLAVVTNVMDEQLNRFHDATIVHGYAKQLAARSQAVVVNFDDPNLSDIEGIGFGLAPSLQARETAPRYALSSNAPRRGASVTVESVEGGSFSLRCASGQLDVTAAQPGVHVAHNVAAALAAAEAIVGILDLVATKRALEDSTGVFGRDSRVSIAGVETRILLVQNPESFRINNALIGNPEQLLVAIGSDVRDPSWLWSVDFAGFPGVFLLSGRHAYPMASRLDSQGVSVGRIEINFEKALAEFTALAPPVSGERVLVLTADTFRRTKRRWQLGA